MITQENIPYTADEIKAMAKTCEKYNKAREKARELMNKGYDVLMPEIFPELNENEDEKIKREIVAYINELADLKNEKIPTKWLAWLEEQKDYIKLPNSAYTSNKDVIEFADTYSHDVWEKLMDNFKKIENYHIGCNDVSDIVLNAIINTYNWLEKQGAKKRIFNADDWYVSEVDGKIHNSKFIEKQGEKKPTDKVEPKFKIGDWVVNNVCFPMQIASIKDGMYIFTNGDAMSVLFIDGNFHLWTINDAKDGDVLIRETGEPFIHNGNHGSYIPEFLGAYCGISDGRFRPNGSPYYWGKPSCPATKEQRDLLFSKMKEEGYEWDANKKELKKMESKTLNADKVIEWLDKQACLGWLEDIEVEKVVEQFKKDFGL